MPSTPGAGGGALVAGIAVAQTVSWGVLYYAFSVLLVPMQRDLGWSRGALVGGFTLAVVLSGLAAPAVGRLLDRGRERAVMAGGAAAGAALVVAWSRVGSAPAYLAVWCGIGLVMATVLYDPAFTVLARRRAPHHRRAITAVTLVAGLASTIFQPLTGALAEAFGWRSALLVLAGALVATTLPIHLVVLRGAAPSAGPAMPTATVTASPPPASAPVRSRVRRIARPPEADRRFWTLTGALAAVTATSSAAGVLLVAHLVDHGWTLGSAAGAGGVLGAMQLPGRLAFGPLAARFPAPTVAAAVLALPAAGTLVLVAAGGGLLVWPAVALLGLGQGATTLLRATAFVDLHGTARIGALNGLAGSRITVARAVAPLVAALAATRVGFAPTFVVLAAGALAAAAVARGALTVGTAPGPSPVHLRRPGGLREVAGGTASNEVEDPHG